jgi:hypothetical protein
MAVAMRVITREQESNRRFMEHFKKTLLTVCQVILWLMFLCAINDPGMVGPRPEESIYHTYAFLLQPVYTLGGYLILPVQWLFVKAGWYHPELAAHSSHQHGNVVQCVCDPDGLGQCV